MSSSKTVRILDFEGYREIIEQVRDFENDPHFVIGTQAPERDFADMVDEWVHLVGSSGVRDFAIDSDPSTELLDDDRNPIDVDVPDHVTDETPSHYLDEPEIGADDGVKRIGDAAFPAYGFADQGSTDELEQADRTLIGTTIYPGDAVRSAHPGVLTVADMLDTVDALFDEYDADEYAIMIGAFSPKDSYRIMSEGPVQRTADVIFPSDAFTSTDSIDSVGAGNPALYGTVIVERDALSEDAKALVDGDVDEIGPDEADEQAETPGVDA